MGGDKVVVYQQLEVGWKKANSFNLIVLNDAGEVVDIFGGHLDAGENDEKFAALGEFWNDDKEGVSTESFAVSFDESRDQTHKGAEFNVPAVAEAAIRQWHAQHCSIIGPFLSDL
jgi:hypothetical protein